MGKGADKGAGGQAWASWGHSAKREKERVAPVPVKGEPGGLELQGFSWTVMHKLGKDDRRARALAEHSRLKPLHFSTKSARLLQAVPCLRRASASPGWECYAIGVATLKGHDITTQQLKYSRMLHIPTAALAARGCCGWLEK